MYAWAADQDLTVTFVTYAAFRLTPLGRRRFRLRPFSSGLNSVPKRQIGSFSFVAVELPGVDAFENVGVSPMD